MNQEMLQEMSVYFPRLDDFYEEGTWLPTYGGATTAGTTAYTDGYQNGIYTRQGRVITAHLSLAWGTASGTGTSRVSLPVANGSTIEITCELYSDRIAFSGNTLKGYIAPGANYMDIYVMKSAAATPLNVVANGYLIGTMTYPIDA